MEILVRFVSEFMTDTAQLRGSVADPGIDRRGGAPIFFKNLFLYALEGEHSVENFEN